MEIQQAIKIMKTEAECVSRNDGKNCDRDCGKCDLLLAVSEILEAYQVVISAAEKQIAKTPHYEGDAYDDDVELIYDTWICPNCGEHYEVGYDNQDYCPNCGQHIQHEDWELE